VFNISILQPRQTLNSGPRASSPTWLTADDSNDSINLDPELAQIARDIRTAPATTTTTTTIGESGGGPEVVTVKVKWQPHPLDDAARPMVWGFKIKRVSGLSFSLHFVLDVLPVVFFWWWYG
jgi:hypothetical protein